MSTKELSSEKLRNYICIEPECNTHYQRQRFVAPGKRKCDSCQGKAKNDNRLKGSTLADGRIDNLPNNDEFRWLLGECRRAKTVEILTGHTVDSLHALLIEIREYHRTCYGFDGKKSYYHLCHVQPVGKEADEFIGLLHPLSLFVGRDFHNQRQLDKPVPADAGMRIPRSKLKPKWKIKPRESDKDILEKIKKFLGQTLHEYAKKYPIKKSTRVAQAQWVYANQARFQSTASTAHYEEFFSVHRTLPELKKLSKLELSKLRAAIQGKTLKLREMDRRRSLVVYRDELKRFADTLPDGRHRDTCRAVLPVVELVGAFLQANRNIHLGSDMDSFGGLESFLSVFVWDGWKFLQLRPATSHIGHLPESLLLELESSLRDWISLTAFDALQGNLVNVDEVRGALHKKLSIATLTPDMQFQTYLHDGEQDVAEGVELEVQRIHGLMVETGFISEAEAIQSQEQMRSPAPKPVFAPVCDDDLLPWAEAA